MNQPTFKLKTNGQYEAEADVCDLDVLVGFDYEPREEPVYYPNDRAYPGAAEQASATQVLTTEGHDIMPCLTQDCIERLEEKCLESMQYRHEYDCDREGV